MSDLKCNKETTTAFELVGSYFVDVFYNELFLKAKNDLQNQGKGTLTDYYKSNILTYTRAVSGGSQYYVQMVKLLSQYYSQNCMQYTMTLPDFEDKILSYFVPPEYFGDLTNDDKDMILHEIFITTIREFSKEILTNEIRNIIDGHQSQTNIVRLQEKIFNILLEIRDDYYHKFIDQVSRSNSKTVSQSTFEKVKSALVAETKRRVTAEEDKDRAIRLLKAALGQITSLKSEVESLKSEVESLKSGARSTKVETRTLTPGSIVSPVGIREVSNRQMSSQIPSQSSKNYQTLGQMPGQMPERKLEQKTKVRESSPMERLAEPWQGGLTMSSLTSMRTPVSTPLPPTPASAPESNNFWDSSPQTMTKSSVEKKEGNSKLAVQPQVQLMTNPSANPSVEPMVEPVVDLVAEPQDPIPRIEEVEEDSDESEDAESLARKQKEAREKRMNNDDPGFGV